MLILALLLTPVALAGPSWISQNTYVKQGNELFVVCSADTGLLDLAAARNAAMESCVQSAALALPTTWKVSSKTTETDIDVMLEKKVAATQKIEGLACDIKDEHLEHSETSAKVWLRCRFDLSKAKSVPVEIARPAGNRAVMIDSTPECDYVILRGGGYARKVRCQGGATAVSIRPGEHTIAVDADGYVRKEIKLQEDVRYESLIVSLDKIP